MNTCPEVQRRLYDPALIDFTVAENPRNGVVGLTNLGNTCYMNSALQCLSNTPTLVTYFCKLALFKEELNTDNALASKNSQIVVFFAKFLHNMWNTKKGAVHNVFTPAELKRAISSENELFKGYAQHDSNELVQFLLDQLHEDLNRVKKKPIIEEELESKLQNLSDVALASYFREVHLERNQSVINDLMSGQFKSTIVCQQCKTPSRKFQSFLTLPVQVTSQTFDLTFHFFPHLPSDRSFHHQLEGLSTISEVINGSSSLDLYWLKKKICEVVNHYYTKDTHLDPKTKQQCRFSLSFANGDPLSEYSLPLTPFDLMIASVGKPTSYGAAFRFNKIFGDHLHNLIDVQNQINSGEEICVYQLDPEAIDRHKIAHMEDKQHLLRFPEYLKPGYMMAPCEVLTLQKPEYGPSTEKDCQKQTLIPRFACFSLEWSLPQVHRRIMSVFCHALESQTPYGYPGHYGGQNPSTKMAHRRHKAPTHYGHDDEYEVNHDLSDDDDQI
jgi:hypothetical protein